MSFESAIQHYPEHWIQTTLGELCKSGDGSIQTGPFGSQLHASDYVVSGIPSIMPKNISVEKISTDDIAYISREDAQRLSKYLVREGDIVYSRRGDVEKCALITDVEDGWLCGTGCLRVRLGCDGQVSPDFVHAYLSLPAIRSWIAKRAVGATMPNLNTSILSEVPVLVPPLAERELVQDVWGNLIKKINLNTQTNQTLEQIAQAIFKSWFVDFDPVKAKMTALAAGGSREDAERAAMCAISGKDETVLDAMQHEQPAAYAELAATAALFPAAMQESELGDVPEGWEVANLASLADVIMGQSPKGDSYNDQGDGVCLVNGPVEFGDRHPKQTKWTTAPNKLSKKNDLIVCVRGSTTGKFVKSDGEYCLGRGVCAIRSDFQVFVDELFKFDLEKLLMLTTGSTFPNWSRDSLSNHKFARPSDLLLLFFSEKIGRLSDRISSNSIESEQLSLIRDSLLPKLLSGEIDLSNLPDPAEVA